MFLVVIGDGSMERTSGTDFFRGLKGERGDKGVFGSVGSFCGSSVKAFAMLPRTSIERACLTLLMLYKSVIFFILIVTRR